MPEAQRARLTRVCRRRGVVGKFFFCSPNARRLDRTTPKGLEGVDIRPFRECWGLPQRATQVRHLIHRAGGYAKGRSNLPSLFAQAGGRLPFAKTADYEHHPVETSSRLWRVEEGRHQDHTGPADRPRLTPLSKDPISVRRLIRPQFADNSVRELPEGIKACRDRDASAAEKDHISLGLLLQEVRGDDWPAVMKAHRAPIASNGFRVTYSVEFQPARPFQ